MHARDLVIFRLLKSLRQMHRADTWLLSMINQFLRVQCVLCGALYKSLEDRDRHQSICQIRFLSLSYYYGQSMETLEPLHNLYTADKIREIENRHAYQQIAALGEKVMEGRVLTTHKIGNLATAFDDDDRSSVGGKEREEAAATTKRDGQKVLSSFQRILMEETDVDLVFESGNRSKERSEADPSLVAYDEDTDEAASNKDDDEEEEPAYKRPKTSSPVASLPDIEIQAVDEPSQAAWGPTEEDFNSSSTAKNKGKGKKSDEATTKAASGEGSGRSSTAEEESPKKKKKRSYDKPFTPITYLDALEADKDLSIPQVRRSAPPTDPERVMFPPPSTKRLHPFQRSASTGRSDDGQACPKRKKKSASFYKKAKELVHIQMQQLKKLSDSMKSTDDDDAVVSSDSNADKDDIEEIEDDDEDAEAR